MRSPFKFLDAYTVRDKNVFFGRDTEIETLYSLVFKSNLHVVYGLSGTGKTSLIQCGLASKFDGPDWYPMFIRRNEDLNESVKLAMRTALGADAKDDLVENVSYLMRKTLRPVYLILDQFEELFILGKQPEQETFMRDLRRLLDAGMNAKVILVLREEYIGQLYPFEQIVPELFDFRFRVEPMGILKVQSVIQESFDKFNIHLEEPRQELLQFMTDQISDPKTGIALPYLQVYLDMLYRDVYRKKFGKTDAPEDLPHLDITKQDISSLGKIGNVLEKFLAQQLRELTEVMQQDDPAFPANGIQMVLDPFATDEGTKRPVHYERSQEVIELDATVRKAMPDLPEASLSRAIDLLEQARILRVREDTIELAHDSLAAIIDRKRTDEQRQLQNVRRRLMNAYEEFQKTGLYLNEKQLAAFDVFVPELNLGEDLQKFIRDSGVDVQQKADEERNRANQEQEVKQQRKLARTRGILLGIVALFAGAAVLFAIKSHTHLQTSIAYNEKADSTIAVQQAQQDTLSRKQDSIKTLLDNIGLQVYLFDSLVGNSPEGDVPKVEVMKAVIALKSLMTNDTITEQDLIDNYASVIGSIIITSGMQNDTQPMPPRSEFTVNQEVFAFARVLKKKDKEFLQVKWLDLEGKLIGSPVYPEVFGANTMEQLHFSTKFSESGKYSLRLYNSLGIEMSSAEFIVKDDDNTDRLEILPGNFKIVSSVVNGRAGKEIKKFRSGGTVYYWGRIKCPKEKAIVIVTVEQSGNILWEKKHDIARNTNPGYMIWSAKSFKGEGTYTVRVKSGLGDALFETSFKME